jgi:hypothetical protein
MHASTSKRGRLPSPQTLACAVAAPAAATVEASDETTTKNNKKMKKGGSSGGNVLLRVAVAAKGGEVRLWDVPVSKQHGVNLLQSTRRRPFSSALSSSSSSSSSSSFYRSSRDQLSDADASLLFGGAFGSLALPEAVTALALLPNGAAAYAGLRDGTLHFLECSRVYATRHSG